MNGLSQTVKKENLFFFVEMVKGRWFKSQTSTFRNSIMVRLMKKKGEEKNIKSRSSFYNKRTIMTINVTVWCRSQILVSFLDTYLHVTSLAILESRHLSEPNRVRKVKCNFIFYSYFKNLDKRPAATIPNEMKRSKKRARESSKPSRNHRMVWRQRWK